jgi:hypothetical protein
LSFHKIKTDTTIAAQEEVEFFFLMTVREKKQKVKHNCGAAV